MFPWFFGLLVLLSFVSSCKMEHHPAKDVPTSAYSTQGYTYTFNDDIQPIFKQHCVGCHSEFSKYKNVKNKLSEIKRRVLGKVSKSGKMPPSGSLSKDELKMIRIWIEEGAPEKGKKKAGVQKTKKPTMVAKKSVVKKCTLCHGKDGISSNPETPNLKGQSYDYLVARLIAYKSGKEKSVMANIVKGLTQKEMKEVARYFSVLSPLDPISSASDHIKDKLIRGKCIECHGWKGPSRPGVPYLAGQNIKYLKKQLKAFFMGKDQAQRIITKPIHPMMVWAKNVTGTWTQVDIDRVAEFFSKLYAPKNVTEPETIPVIKKNTNKKKKSNNEDEDEDENLFESCFDCHSENGIEEDEETPHLAGQDRKYLMNQLMAFKRGTRKGEAMDEQLEDIPQKFLSVIADYFSNIDYWKRPKAPKLISEKGCISCHGKNGVSAKNKKVPHLAGQKSSYLIQRMKDFKKSSSHIMCFAVKGLTDKQLKKIAHYYSSFNADGTIKKKISSKK